MADSEAPKIPKGNVDAAERIEEASTSTAAAAERTANAMEEQLDTAQRLRDYQKELNKLRESEVGFLKLGFTISDKIQKVKDVEVRREQELQELAVKITKLQESNDPRDKEKLVKLKAQAAQLNDQNRMFQRQAFYLKASILAEEAFGVASSLVYETQDKIAGALGKGVLELAKQRSLFGIIQTSIKTVLDFALAIDDELVKQNRELGFSRDANKDLNDLTLQIYKNNVANGLTLDDAVKSTSALTKTFGKSFAQTEGLAENLAQLENKMGIAAESSAIFLDNMGAVAGDVNSASDSSIIFAKQISKTSGVPLPDLMKEAAESSGDLAIFSGQSGTNILKAAANAKLLGVSLNSFVAASSKSLQFQSSIQAELKASVLLGKNLNLQALRRAAFNKDTLGVERELQNIIKRTGKSLKDLDPIQMQALADATGLTAEEMLKIENRRKLDNKTLKEIEKINKSTLADKEKSARQDAISAANLNQVRLLGTRISGLLAEVVVPLIPQINRVMVGIANFFTNNKEAIQSLAKSLVDSIVPALKFIATNFLGTGGGQGLGFAMIQPGPWVKWAAIIAGSVLSLNLLVKGIKGIGSAINATVVKPVKSVIDTAKTAIDFGKKGINVFKGFRKGGIKGAIGAAMAGKKEEDKCCAGVSGAADSIATVAETMTKGGFATRLALTLKTVLAGLLTKLTTLLTTSLGGIITGGATMIAGALASAAATFFGGLYLGGVLEEKFGLGTKMLDSDLPFGMGSFRENSALYRYGGSIPFTDGKYGAYEAEQRLEESKKELAAMEAKFTEKKVRSKLGLSTKGELTPEQQAAVNGLVERFGEKLANLPPSVVQVEYSRFQQNSAVSANRGNKNQVSVMPQIN